MLVVDHDSENQVGRPQTLISPTELGSNAHSPAELWNYLSYLPRIN